MVSAPVIHGSPIYQPRRDGWLSWPSWLTHMGQFSHNVATALHSQRHKSYVYIAFITYILHQSYLSSGENCVLPILVQAATNVLE